MAKGTIAGRAPMVVSVTEGKTYWWCACGLSKKQPFCDGSHAKTDMAPVEYRATESKDRYFCLCKQTGNEPLCDGTHNGL